MRDETQVTLSVVVPTYETRALTLRCLGALERELPPDGEVVVVDDGSRDDTAAAVADCFPDVRLLVHASNRGFTASANAGLALARGRTLWLLNSDTEVEPGAVTRLLESFASRPRLGAAGAELIFPDGRPQWSGGGVPDLRWLFALASGLGTLAARVPGYRRWRPIAGHAGARVDWVPGTALALRAEAWRAVGPFDEALRLYAQDLDLCLRLGAAGWEVAVVRGLRVRHQGGATIERLPNATTARQVPELLWCDLLRVIAKHQGGAPAARAARALRVGATLRIVGRRLALPVVSGSRRSDWRRDTRAYERARAALATVR
jgi:hypothetical protein